MSALEKLKPLSESQVAGVDQHLVAGVDLRRDIYQLVRYVKDKGLVRTVRGNNIPKAAARRMAKLLSYGEEAAAVEKSGSGFWSDYVSQVARLMGLVTFETKGVFVGYSSTEPSFPENEIKVDDNAWRAYLDKTPLQKERALLDACCRLTGNEFFNHATLIVGQRFDGFGCATGPAGAMDLPSIRRGLMQFLATLEAGRWYETRDVVDLLETQHPHLILDPATRKPDAASCRSLREWEREWEYRRKKKDRPPKPETKLEDIYTNFREYKSDESRWSREGQRQITSGTVDSFHRVEGRYLEYFLSEIPFILRFVELAFRRPSDKHGLDVFPSFERLRAFRLTPRFFQAMRGDTELDRVKVTVLPTFEVLVEAPSYPDVVLDTLAPFTSKIDEDGPIHRLRLEKGKIVEQAARDPKAPSVIRLLEQLSGSIVPQNVAAEYADWSKRGEKVIFYEGYGLLEPKGESDRRAALKDIGELVADDRLDGFAVVRKPDRVFELLEERLHVPIRVNHEEHAFVRCAGRLGAGPKDGKPKKEKRLPSAKAKTVCLEAEDLVGYRASDASLLSELQQMLRLEARTCTIADGNLLVISAKDLSRLRVALRKVSDRFEVTLGVLGD